MAWIIGIIAILLIGGLIELFYEKGFRNKLSAFFGGIALIASLVLFVCIAFLSYVGVWVIYIGVPTALISGFFWWLFLPKNKNSSLEQSK